LRDAEGDREGAQFRWDLHREEVEMERRGRVRESGEGDVRGMGWEWMTRKWSWREDGRRRWVGEECNDGGRGRGLFRWAPLHPLTGTQPRTVGVGVTLTTVVYSTPSGCITRGERADEAVVTSTLHPRHRPSPIFPSLSSLLSVSGRL
jgi:hypothetical protein